MVNVFPFLIFLFIFYCNKRYVGRFFCLSNYIHIIYMLSTLSFLLMKFVGDKKPFNIEALSLLVLSNTLLVWPLSVFEKRMGEKGLSLSTIKTEKIRIFCWFLIVVSLISILFFAVNLGTFFTVDVVELRAGHGSLYKGGTILSKIACFGAYLYPLCLFMYFYNNVKKQLPKKVTNLLLFSSLSFVIYGLNVAGRDGIVLWFLVYIGMYFLFRFFMDNKNVKMHRRVLLYVGSVALPLLFLISIARFSNSQYGTAWSMADYMGQCLGNLSQNIDAYEKTEIHPMDDRGLFELVYNIGDLLSGNVHQRHNRFGMSYTEELWLTGNGFTPFSFCYYIGSIYPLCSSIIIYFIFILTMYFVIKNNLCVIGKQVSSKKLIVAFSWYTILIYGVFYFYYGTFIGNFFLLITLFIPFVL